jgi:hypothetical protein
MAGSSGNGRGRPVRAGSGPPNSAPTRLNDSFVTDENGGAIRRTEDDKSSPERRRNALRNQRRSLGLSGREPGDGFRRFGLLELGPCVRHGAEERGLSLIVSTRALGGHRRGAVQRSKERGLVLLQGGPADRVHRGRYRSIEFRGYREPRRFDALAMFAIRFQAMRDAFHVNGLD